MQTRTGNFPLGFRRSSAAWQADLSRLMTWMKDTDLSVIDLGRDGDQYAKTVVKAGLRVGSVDLLQWKEMLSPDQATRATAVERNSEYIRACAAAGPMNHFLVMLPEDPDRPRAENFDYMVDSFRQLAPVLEENQARVVVEGWPGPGALACTPEGYRALFKAVDSPAMGVNYDPSHLIRMGIDHLRFLDEFMDRVYHVHGKDTELLAENLYEYGNEQPPTFAQKFRYGALHWRYTIPGHGITRWSEVFRRLAAHNYQGAVSIELEDAYFNGETESEKIGILQGARFLTSC